MSLGERIKNTKTGLIGTIFAVKTEEYCNGDGYTGQRELSYSVRFDNGLLAEVDRQDVTMACDTYPGHEPTTLYVVCTPALYVNVYISDRAYGGPEEGGWYYDTWEYVPSESVIGTSEDDAERLREEKQKWADEENKTRRGPSSVLSEGHYKVRHETGPGASGDNYSPYC